ncbi:GvpL/GvpF family gas vesicle protein [Streptomyces sp. NPDC001889]
METDGILVYAIVRAGARLPRGTKGVGGGDVVLRAVGGGTTAVVVGDAPAQVRARRRDLLAHQDLLMGLAERGPVLPMRFGVMAPDEETLLRRLAAEESSHVANLKRLAGHVELNVKAMPAEDGLAALLSEDVKVRQLREEIRRRPGYEASVRLGEAVVAGLFRRAAEAGRGVLGALTPLARATAPGPEVRGCALNVSFLVRRAVAERFRTRVQRLAHLHRDHAELRVSGPLPCYSFVDARTSAALTGGS